EELKRAEKEEEAKLKAKYPSVPRPGPQLLQKRLQKGQKYFDSGDYNMAKAATKTRLPASTLSHQPGLLGGCEAPLPPPPTGDTIPTPDCLPTRKTSIHVQSKLAAGSP
ncbi:cAMP-regulated phosphoprotein 19-A-like protein, partial [Dinothrombium tinctorium]